MEWPSGLLWGFRATCSASYRPNESIESTAHAMDSRQRTLHTAYTAHGLQTSLFPVSPLDNCVDMNQNEKHHTTPASHCITLPVLHALLKLTGKCLTTLRCNTAQHCRQLFARGLPDHCTCSYSVLNRRTGTGHTHCGANV